MWAETRRATASLTATVLPRTVFPAAMATRAPAEPAARAHPRRRRRPTGIRRTTSRPAAPASRHRPGRPPARVPAAATPPPPPEFPRSTPSPPPTGPTGRPGSPTSPDPTRPPRRPTPPTGRRPGRRPQPRLLAGTAAELAGLRRPAPRRRPGPSRRTRARAPARRSSFWKELPLLIVVALVLTFLIQTFLAKVYVIPSGSMETTLHGCVGCNNDRVLVDKISYGFGEPGSRRRRRVPRSGQLEQRGHRPAADQRAGPRPAAARLAGRAGPAGREGLRQAGDRRRRPDRAVLRQRQPGAGRRPAARRALHLLPARGRAAPAERVRSGRGARRAAVDDGRQPQQLGRLAGGRPRPGAGRQRDRQGAAGSCCRSTGSARSSAVDPQTTAVGQPAPGSDVPGSDLGAPAGARAARRAAAGRGRDAGSTAIARTDLDAFLPDPACDPSKRRR